MSETLAGLVERVLGLLGEPRPSTRFRPSAGSGTEPAQDTEGGETEPAQDTQRHGTEPAQDTEDHLTEPAQDTEGGETEPAQDTQRHGTEPAQDTEDRLTEPAQDTEDRLTEPAQDTEKGKTEPDTGGHGFEPVRGTGVRVLIGITGAPGAGKSTLAECLVAELSDRLGAEGVAHVPMDGYHLADVELARLGRLDRKGAPDTFDGAGYAALLGRLQDVGARSETVYAPQFERTIEQPVAGAIPVGPAVRVVVSEGNYLLLPDGPWPAARARLTEVWYAEPAEERRLAQLTARHEEFGKSPELAAHWATGPDQRNAELVRATRELADLIVGEDVLAGLPARAVGADG